MKVKYWIIPAILIIVSACTKDKYGEEAKLTFKSVNKDYLFVEDEDLRVELDYLHRTGDLKEMDIYYSKESSSECPQANIPPTTGNFRTATEMPNVRKGVLEIYLNNLTLARNNCDVLDSLETAVFKFWFIDKDGFSSDTAVTPPIQIEKHTP